MICCINHRRQYCVVAKKSSSGVWQTGSNTHASTAAIWFQASWQPPLGPRFLMNKIEIIQESSSECYCECCQHYHPEASEQRAAARLRWGGSHLPVSVLGGCRALPTRGSTYLKSSPWGKKERYRHKMFNHFWVIFMMELQATFVLFFCASLQWIYATY